MVPPLFELTGAAVRGPLGKVIDPLDLTLRDNAVTALVGPVGSGKSTLLRALSGRELPDGWMVDGQWRYRGHDLSPIWRRGVPLHDTAWVPQLRNGPVTERLRATELATILARLDCAFFCGARVVMLDEPTRGLPEADVAALATKIREHAATGAAIVISHNLEFTRHVADDVCMLCEGDLITHSSATAFFDRPDEDLVAQFVRHGSCARYAPPPTLPRHFRWFDPGSVAGMGRPGLLRDLDEDLFAIANAGVTLLVSLTEDPLPTRRLRPFGIGGRHFPIRDMGIPTMSETMALCHDLLQAVGRGQVIAVHCHAGLGRTGTIIACLMICRGSTSDAAIAEVRRIKPQSIQTSGQESFIRAFESRVASAPPTAMTI